MGLLFAGVAGSLWYSGGPFQYTQSQMWLNVFRLVPRLLINRLVHGRFLDVFITHASPQGIHDQPDLTHQGIRSFLWLNRVFKPRIHLHGHIHYYHPDTVTESLYENTRVINTFRYRVIEI